MSMEHPEGFGSASASEVLAPPPGPGYNFRPRSRSATAPKNRRLGSVETPGAGSTLDQSTTTPPNSPTPRGAGIPTQAHTLMSNPIVAGVSGGSLQIPDTHSGEVESVDSTLIPTTVGTKLLSPTLLFPTLVTNTVLSEFRNSTLAHNTVEASSRSSLTYSTLIALNSTPSSSSPNSTLVHNPVAANNLFSTHAIAN